MNEHIEYIKKLIQTHYLAKISHISPTYSISYRLEKYVYIKIKRCPVHGENRGQGQIKCFRNVVQNLLRFIFYKRNFNFNHRHLSIYVRVALDRMTYEFNSKCQVRLK